MSYRTNRDLVIHNIRNISTGGIFIKSHHSPQVGTRIRFRLHHSRFQDPLSLTGEVAWLQPGGGFGVKFSGLDEAVQARLSRLVSRCAMVAEATLYPSDMQ